MGRKVCLVAAVAVACAVASTVASAVASDVASAVASDACTSPIVAGQVPFNNTGTVELWSVVTQNMKEVQVSAEGALTVQHGARAYLVPGCPQSFTGGMYEGLDLVNAVLSFTVDLSTAGCACNAAMYTTAMPAVNRSQEPDPTRCQDFYCDANDVCGLWCPEMDIMEANTAGPSFPLLRPLSSSRVPVSPPHAPPPPSPRAQRCKSRRTSATPRRGTFTRPVTGGAAPSTPTGSWAHRRTVRAAGSSLTRRGPSPSRPRSRLDRTGS